MIGAQLDWMVVSNLGDSRIVLSMNGNNERFPSVMSGAPRATLSEMLQVSCSNIQQGSLLPLMETRGSCQLTTNAFSQHSYNRVFNVLTHIK